MKIKIPFRVFVVVYFIRPNIFLHFLLASESLFVFQVLRFTIFSLNELSVFSNGFLEISSSTDCNSICFGSLCLEISCTFYDALTGKYDIESRERKFSRNSLEFNEQRKCFSCKFNLIFFPIWIFSFLILLAAFNKKKATGKSICFAKDIESDKSRTQHVRAQTFAGR